MLYSRGFVDIVHHTDSGLLAHVKSSCAPRFCWQLSMTLIWSCLSQRDVLTSLFCWRLPTIWISYSPSWADFMCSLFCWHRSLTWLSSSPSPMDAMRSLFWWRLSTGWTSFSCFLSEEITSAFSALPSWITDVADFRAVLAFSLLRSALYQSRRRWWAFWNIWTLGTKLKKVSDFLLKDSVDVFVEPDDIPVHWKTVLYVAAIISCPWREKGGEKYLLVRFDMEVVAGYIEDEAEAGEVVEKLFSIRMYCCFRTKGMEFEFLKLAKCWDGDWFVWLWYWIGGPCKRGSCCGRGALQIVLVSKVFKAYSEILKGSLGCWGISDKASALPSVENVWYSDVFGDFVDRPPPHWALLIIILSLLRVFTSSICCGVLSLLYRASFSRWHLLGSSLVIRSIILESFVTLS